MRVAVALALAVPVLLAPAPAHAVEEGEYPCIELENTGSTESYVTDAASPPLAALGIAEAHAAMTTSGLPGAGVSVAVIDSGVAPNPLLDVVRGPRFSNLPAILNYHGSAVAGLIAAKPRGEQLTGIAPGATIVDVRVYDDDDATQDENAAPVETARVIQGINWVATHARQMDIGVATIALRVSPSKPLEKAIARLHDADVVIVAASGNRPADDTDPLFARYGERADGEDAAGDIFPAGYADDVVAASATVTGSPDEAEGLDASGYVLQSSAIDVAVPTYNAVSTGLNASSCLLPDVATSWAAGEVSGVVALLRAQFPDDSADQIVARLKETASGAVDDRNVLTGAGVVQPVEALTRTLTPDKGGEIDRRPVEESDIPPATSPRAQADPLAGARDNAVWFGLLGGAAVVLALLLRPVLARRRT